MLGGAQWFRRCPKYPKIRWKYTAITWLILRTFQAWCEATKWLSWGPERDIDNSIVWEHLSYLFDMSICYLADSWARADVISNSYCRSRTQVEESKALRSTYQVEDTKFGPCFSVRGPGTPKLRRICGHRCEPTVKGFKKWPDVGFRWETPLSYFFQRHGDTYEKPLNRC